VEDGKLIRQFFTRRTLLLSIIFSAGIAFWLRAIPVFYAARLVTLDQTCIFRFGIDAHIQQLIARTVDNLQLTVKVRPHYFPLVGATIAGWRASNNLSEPFFGMSRYAWGGEEIAIERLEISASAQEENFVLIAGNDNSYQLISTPSQILGMGKVGKSLETKFATGYLQLLVNKLHARPGTEFFITHIPKRILTEELRAQFKIYLPAPRIMELVLYDSNWDRAERVIGEVARQYLLAGTECAAHDIDQMLGVVAQSSAELKTQMERCAARLDDFQREQGELDHTAEERLNEQITALKNRIKQLQEKYAPALERLDPEHPALTLLNNRIAELTHEQEVHQQRLASFAELRRRRDLLMRELFIATQQYLDQLNQSQHLKNQRQYLLNNR